MKKIRALVGCEFSGAVRRELRELKVDAWSCDLLPAEDGSKFHIMGDVSKVLQQEWDLGIFFPPCTRLCCSGARWFKSKQDEQKEAIAFFMQFADLSHILHTAIENPIGIMSTQYRKPCQIIQPWMHGHGETKATCLWLKNLPLLVPTNVVKGREQRIHNMPPGPNRGRERSRTYEGIANAMALQWSKYISNL